MDIFNGDEIRYDGVTVAICIGDIPYTLTDRFLSELKHGAMLCEMQEDGDLFTPSEYDEKKKEVVQEAIDATLTHVQKIIDGYVSVDLPEYVDFKDITDREKKIVLAVLEHLRDCKDVTDPDYDEVLNGIPTKPKRKLKRLPNTAGYTYGEFTLKSSGRKCWNAYDDGDNPVVTAPTLKQLRQEIDKL